MTNMYAKYHELRQKKEGLEMELTQLNKEIEEVISIISREMEDSKVDKAKSHGYSFTRSSDFSPKVRDWSVVHNYIRNTGEFELLHKRISTNVFKKMIYEGKTIDGIEAVPFTKLNIRRSSND
jgi:hypothetical protein